MEFEDEITVITPYETLAQVAVQWQKRLTRENLKLSNEETQENATQIHETR